MKQKAYAAAGVDIDFGKATSWTAVAERSGDTAFARALDRI